jgi:hypothetical protein
MTTDNNDAPHLQQPGPEQPWQTWAVTSDTDTAWDTHVPDGPQLLRPVADLQREGKLRNGT